MEFLEKYKGDNKIPMPLERGQMLYLQRISSTFVNLRDELNRLAQLEGDILDNPYARLEQTIKQQIAITTQVCFHA